MNIKLDEQKQILHSLLPELEKLGDALGIEDLRSRLNELDGQVADPNFWNDIENSQIVLKESKNIRTKLDKFGALSTEINDTLELIDMVDDADDSSMVDEIVASTKQASTRLEDQKLETLLAGEYDGNNAILTLHAGAGGTEAQDWAEMLYRMYTRWAERRGFTYKLLDHQPGDEAGIKSASILVEGYNAYGYLKSEAGVHRLVRISPFDSSGRRHTSFASVEIVPEIDDSIEIEIDDNDLRIDTFRASGAGGQHVNMTDSAVRITHLPTGVVTSCQNERSQRQNRETAMKMLISKLVEIKEREHLEHIDDIKGEHKEIGWGSQIRSYVFMPYTMAKDHRTNQENGNISAVMDGEIDDFINAYLRDKSLGKI